MCNRLAFVTAVPHAKVPVVCNVTVFSDPLSDSYFYVSYFVTAIYPGLSNYDII